MGLGIGKPGYNHLFGYGENQPKLPNPDPTNYEVKEYFQVGKHLVVIIFYIGCTNYEGRKVLLFKNVQYKTLVDQKSIDPHFSDSNNKISPFARFEPTQEGIDAAIFLAEKLKEYK